MHDFVTSFISQLEDAGSLSYTVPYQVEISPVYSWVTKSKKDK